VRLVDRSIDLFVASSDIVARIIALIPNNGFSVNERSLDLRRLILRRRIHKLLRRAFSPADVLTALPGDAHINIRERRCFVARYV